MIADPIDFRNREWSTLDYAGQRVLFIVDGMIELADFCGNPNGAVDPIWSSHPKSNYHQIHGYKVSLEVFFDRMAVEFPEHLEWLLFHPEWL